MGVQVLVPPLTSSFIQSFIQEHLPLANFIRYDSTVPCLGTAPRQGEGGTCCVTEGSTGSVVPRGSPVVGKHFQKRGYQLGFLRQRGVYTPQEKGVYSRIEELHITLTSNPSSLSCDGE